MEEGTKPDATGSGARGAPTREPAGGTYRLHPAALRKLLFRLALDHDQAPAAVSVRHRDALDASTGISRPHPRTRALRAGLAALGEPGGRVQKPPVGTCLTLLICSCIAPTTSQIRSLNNTEDAQDESNHAEERRIPVPPRGLHVDSCARKPLPKRLEEDGDSKAEQCNEQQCTRPWPGREERSSASKDRQIGKYCSYHGEQHSSDYSEPDSTKVGLASSEFLRQKGKKRFDLNGIGSLHFQPSGEILQINCHPRDWSAARVIPKLYVVNGRPTGSQALEIGFTLIVTESALSPSCSWHNCKDLASLPALALLMAWTKFSTSSDSSW
jgi:hypothetical protein